LNDARNSTMAVNSSKVPGRLPENALWLTSMRVSRVRRPRPLGSEPVIWFWDTSSTLAAKGEGVRRGWGREKERDRG
jgi:hypothetical protein